MHEAIGVIQLHTIDNVLKTWTDRVGYCMASRDSHLNEIIFHYYPEGLCLQIKKKSEKILSSFFKAFSKKRCLAEPVQCGTRTCLTFLQTKAHALIL